MGYNLAFVDHQNSVLSVSILPRTLEELSWFFVGLLLGNYGHGLPSTTCHPPHIPSAGSWSRHLHVRTLLRLSQLADTC